MSRLFIGMPVFEMDRFVKEAIESLIGQSFEDWRMLIADNQSGDATPEICRRAAALDSRISFVRHERNLGAPANFRFLLDTADTDVFMWAAGDDVWAPGFLERGIQVLEHDSTVGLAFGDVVNTDTYGAVVRSYPGFARLSGQVGRKTVGSYLLMPEIMGKANLIYGMMPTTVARAAFEVSPLTDNWGSDMAYVLAVISRARFAYAPPMLLRKRVVRRIDRPFRPAPIVITEPEDHCFPLAAAPSYIADHLRATKGTPFLGLTASIMTRRLVSIVCRKGRARGKLVCRAAWNRLTLR
jgi:glycosyltransferase involved in cell wall biosynthesis